MWRDAAAKGIISPEFSALLYPTIGMSLTGLVLNAF